MPDTVVPLPDRVRLVVLFGGRSPEHDVSCVSAREVIAALDRDRYEIVPVGIGRDGTWMLSAATSARLDRGEELPPALEVGGDAVAPLPELHRTSGSAPVVVLPVLHGPNGEDGTVQGLLELADVPYVGSGVLGSSLSMDKAKAKEVLAAAGIPQAAHRSHTRWDLADGGDALLDELVATLGLPIFVKPANMGSSIGVSRASTRHELDAAITAALDHDDWLVFEEAVDGREIEIGVLGTTQLRTSVPGEVVPGAEFYDYDDKYRNGAAQIVIPASLPAGVPEEMSRLAMRTFRALRADVLARVDFFYEEGGRGLLVNELNTLPGCTPVSMFPLLWEATGLPYAAMLDELVRLAIERHRRRGRDRAANP